MEAVLLMDVSRFAKGATSPMGEPSPSPYTSPSALGLRGSLRSVKFTVLAAADRVAGDLAA
jgi:hypothetical protein